MPLERRATLRTLFSGKPKDKLSRQTSRPSISAPLELEADASGTDETHRATSAVIDRVAASMDVQASIPGWNLSRDGPLRPSHLPARKTSLAKPSQPSSSEQLRETHFETAEAGRDRSGTSTPSLSAGSSSGRTISPAYPESTDDVDCEGYSVDDDAMSEASFFPPQMLPDLISSTSFPSNPSRPILSELRHTRVVSDTSTLAPTTPPLRASELLPAAQIQCTFPPSSSSSGSPSRPADDLKPQHTRLVAPFSHVSLNDESPLTMLAHGFVILPPPEDRRHQVYPSYKKRASARSALEELHLLRTAREEADTLYSRMKGWAFTPSFGVEQ